MNKAQNPEDLVYIVYALKYQAVRVFAPVYCYSPQRQPTGRNQRLCRSNPLQVASAESGNGNDCRLGTGHCHSEDIGVQH
eukprot:6834377-Lingulodinium_polyedra.AAC.1